MKFLNAERSNKLTLDQVRRNYDSRCVRACVVESTMQRSGIGLLYPTRRHKLVYQAGPPDCDRDIFEELSNLLRLPAIAANADWRVSRLQRFIDGNQGRIGWRLSEVCRQLDLGITAPHLARLFHQGLGLSIREYSKLRRLHTAAIKLRTTSLSVKEIAADLGYHSPADFFRQFKQVFLVTPLTFRSLSRPLMSLRQPID